MAYSEVSPNTGDALSTMDDGSVRKLWQKTVDMFEQTEDFFDQFEGKGKGSPVLIKNDTSKGAGQTMTITNRAGYYGEGKSGDALFEETSDYEVDRINSYTLSVDFLRNATSMTERTEEVMGMRGELRGGQAAELGRWMGREKSARMMMLFRERGLSPNLVFGGGRMAEAEIVSADGLNWDEIVSAQAQLQPMGGRPALMGYDKGRNAIYRYIVAGTTPGLFSLEVDADFKQVLREAGVRGDSNAVFDGGFVDVRGNRIKRFNPIDHDGAGAVGSPWNPKAFLGAAITAGTEAFDVKGGGNITYGALTTPLYFKYFEGHDFEMMAGDLLTASTVEKYFLIVNPRGSGSDQDGKVGMYAFTVGNNGNKITVSKRLGSATAGIRNDTVGEVDWNAGVWNGKHTDVHEVGATIIPCNAKGVPIGDTVIMGANAALRGYGKYRNKRSSESKNGDFVHYRYISSVFGQALRKDTLGRIPGYIRVRHALNYAGLGLPTVT